MVMVDKFYVLKEQAPTSTTMPTAPDDASRQPAQTRLGPLPPVSKLSLNNMVKKTQVQPQAPPQTPPQTLAPTPVEKVRNFFIDGCCTICRYLQDMHVSLKLATNNSLFCSSPITEISDPSNIICLNMFSPT